MFVARNETSRPIEGYLQSPLPVLVFQAKEGRACLFTTTPAEVAPSRDGGSICRLDTRHPSSLCSHRWWFLANNAAFVYTEQWVLSPWRRCLLRMIQTVPFFLEAWVVAGDAEVILGLNVPTGPVARWSWCHSIITVDRTSEHTDPSTPMARWLGDTTGRLIQHIEQARCASEHCLANVMRCFRV